MADFDSLVAGGWPAVVALRDQYESQRFECKGKHDATTPLLAESDADLIAKTIVGLANAGGGLLVFGVDARPQSDGHPDRVIGPLPIAKIAECVKRLQDRLPKLIEPAAQVDMTAIEADDGSGAGVILCNVTMGDGAPHRVSTGRYEGRYFMRAESRTAIMPHVVLAALFGRTPQPKLRLIARWSGSVLSLRLRNEGAGTARQPALFLERPPPSLDARSIRNVNQQDGFRLVYGSQHDRFARVGYVSDQLALYPGLDVDVFTGGFVSPVPHEPELQGVLYALDAKPRPFAGIIPTGNEWIELPRDDEAS